MLEAVDLSKSFGGRIALDRLNLAIQAGETFCLLGANGAGKTTAVNLFLGFVAPDRGRALVDGIEVVADPIAARRRLLHLPEQVVLYGELTGYENLRYFAALAGVEEADATRLRACLDEAGLRRDAHDRRASTYSKGMRQKVGVAFAIAKRATALLLDEPTSGLDPVASAEFYDLVARRRDAGCAVLMVTHDLLRAREIGDRIGLMRDGRLLRTIRAADITAAALDRLYLDEMGRRAAA